MAPAIQALTRNDRFQDGLSKLSKELAEPRHQVEQRAAQAFEEMFTSHQPLAANAFKKLRVLLSSRCRIDVDMQTLLRLRELDKEHTIAWLPSHRSYMDMGHLEDVVQEAGIAPAYVLGGDNLDFWPMGAILRRAGVLFIRRKTHDDPVYRFTLRSYIAHLIEQGRNLCWSIEGGRTRTGKLRPPRYGALRYVIDAVRSSEEADVMVVPVSVVYDQLGEVAAMTAEALGGSKKPEGIGWMLRFGSSQKGRKTDVRIDFAEPMPLRERIRELERDERARGQQVERVALEVCHRINRVTPAVPTAIVTFALLGAERALTVDETIVAMAPMLAYLRDHPTTPNTLATQLDDPGWVRTTLDELADSGVLRRYSGGDQTVWHIAPEQHLVAAFYRNTLIHLLVTRAISELALFIASGQPALDLREALWNHAMSLRQLLKFEFFFPSRGDFLNELLAEVALLDPDWQGRKHKEPVVTKQRVETWLERSQPHLAHLILRPFFDSYLVVAKQLARWPHDREVDREQLLRRCLGFGQQQVLQKKLHSPESVTLELFKTALDLAEHRGLLKGRGREVHEERKAFAAHLEFIVDHLAALARRQSGCVAAQGDAVVKIPIAPPL